MSNKLMKLVLMAAIGLILAACGSDSADNKHPSDVATLKTTESTQVEATADAADPVLDNEAMMMAFTECMRDQGIDLLDPVVDADGNVEKPEFIEGVEYDKEAFGAPWEACEHHLEGFTWEKERVDMSWVTTPSMEPSDQPDIWMETSFLTIWVRRLTAILLFVH